MSQNQNYNECPICMGNAHLPVVTKCGHIFCWDCIKHWVEVKGKSECPLCKNGIRLNEVIKLYSGNNEKKEGEIDDRPQNERMKPENEHGFFRRVANNFGVYGYTNDTTLRPPSRKEVQRNILSLVILIIGIVFIFYIFN